MAATNSIMMPLGTIAPDFRLLDTVTDSMMNLDGLKGRRGTLIMFICNHCPYVIHIKSQLITLANEYRAEGINSVAISSNDIVHYPQDAPDKMAALMADWAFPFDAYLFDESQSVARRYQAACTPDFYLFDDSLRCIYRGRLDGSTPKNSIPVTGVDLRNALNDCIAGDAVSGEQIPSMGCNIKWK